MRCMAQVLVCFRRVLFLLAELVLRAHTPGTRELALKAAGALGCSDERPIGRQLELDVAEASLTLGISVAVGDGDATVRHYLDHLLHQRAALSQRSR